MRQAKAYLGANPILVAATADLDGAYMALKGTLRSLSGDIISDLSPYGSRASTRKGGHECRECMGPAGQG